MAVAIVLLAALLLAALVLVAPRFLRGVPAAFGFPVRSITYAALALLVSEGAARALRVPRRALALGTQREDVLLTLRGAAIGALASSAVILVGAVFGGYTITLAEPEDRQLGPLALDGVAVLASALFEEVAFRSLLVGGLATFAPRSIAMVLPAAFFGIAHAWNQGATLYSTTNTVLAGLLLSIYAFERKPPTLAVAVGFHFAWNFAMGWLWGAPVSGMRGMHHLLVSDPMEALFSGGNYGPEASFLTTIVLLGLAVLTLRFQRNAASSAPLPQRSQ
jgi:hypothetical protein